MTNVKNKNTSFELQDQIRIFPPRKMLLQDNSGRTFHKLGCAACGLTVASTK